MSGYEGEFQMFSAGEGEFGSGIIILDEFCDRAEPCPEAAWPSLRNGNWRIKPLGEDGKPTPLFLLARAFVISLHAAEKRRYWLSPADSEAQAYRELRDDSRADAWARDARLQAVTSCQLMLDDRASELIGSNEQFIGWFKSFRKMLKVEGNRESSEVLKGYIQDLGKCLTQLLTRLESFERNKISRGEYLYPVMPYPDVQPELLALCSVIGHLASLHRRPPTKAEVRNRLTDISDVFARLSFELRRSPNLAELEEELEKDRIRFKLREVATEKNRFQEYLQKIGFQWLPKGKAGRPPKSGVKKPR
ncbi:MAG: hypothetical protein WED15_00465 [Akkermansiaceae bacterium]